MVAFTLASEGSVFLRPSSQLVGHGFSSFLTSSRNELHAKKVHVTKRRRSICTVYASQVRKFDASDFEIQRIIGQQSFATITDWTYYTPTPFAETRTTEPSSPAIRLYDARIVGSFPDLYNARVMLKEFLPAGMELGVTEAEAYNSIYASIDPNDRSDLPVATLMGTFLTDESFESDLFKLSWQSRFPKSPQPPLAGAPFLVFRFEGLTTPLRLVSPSALNNETVDGNQWFDSWFPGNLFRRKANFLRTFIIKSIAALYFLHSKAGLVHRSIGLASIMVNTIEWQYASSLEVKLKDFGFAKRTSQLAEGKDLERARKNEAFTPAQISAFYFAEDVYALGYAITELVFSVFAKQPLTQDTFKKLFEDTFDFNLDAARDYCTQDPSWAEAVQFLDACDRNGWELLFSMLGARKDYSKVSLDELANSPFLTSDF